MVLVIYTTPFIFWMKMNGVVSWGIPQFTQYENID